MMHSVYGYVTGAGGGRQVIIVERDTDNYIPEGTYVMVVPMPAGKPITPEPTDRYPTPTPWYGDGGDPERILAHFGGGARANVYEALSEIAITNFVPGASILVHNATSSPVTVRYGSTVVVIITPGAHGGAVCTGREWKGTWVLGGNR